MDVREQSELIGQIVDAITDPAIADAIAARIEDRVLATLKLAIEEKIDPLRINLDRQITLLEARIGDIATLVAQVHEASLASGRQIDAGLHDLAQQLEMTKVELSGIRHPGASEDTLSTAMFELDEIVRATETATNVILSSAEAIMSRAGEIGAATGDSKAPKIADDMADQVMKIFEACNFQDVTGQRITKVVDTFLTIEERLNSIVRQLGRDSFSHIPVKVPDLNRPDGTVLSGPAQTGFKTSQDDIDALF